MKLRPLAQKAEGVRKEQWIACRACRLWITQGARIQGMYEDAIIASMVIGMPSLIVLFWMVLRHREKMVRKDDISKPAAAAIEARLERLENAIESIAVEVERVGEGQRFTTRLLSERGAVGAPIVTRPTERKNTPH